MKFVLFALVAFLCLSQIGVVSSQSSPSPSSSSSPAPNLESSSEESSSSASNASPNSNAASNLAGMGIAVVLKNRNHIRTIHDRSADHVEREESRKQLMEEQRRKEHFRNIQNLQDKMRQERLSKEHEDRHDRAEGERKSAEEQSVKKASREEADKKDRRDEQNQKQQADFNRKKEEAEKRDEQDKREQTKKTQEVQEQNTKKEQDAKNGVIRKAPFKPSQGNILKPSSEVRFTGEYTYMFWLRPLQTQAPWSNILHKGTTDGTRNPAVWFYPGRTMLHIRSGSSSNWNNGCDTNRDLPIGEWSHIAFIHNSRGITVYYNGKVVCESAYGSPLQNDGPLYTSNPWYTTALCDLADFRMLPSAVDVADIQKAVDTRAGIN